MFIAITGTRKGIGRKLAEYFLDKDNTVIGCSRKKSNLIHPNYTHYCTDIGNEDEVKQLFNKIRSQHGQLDVLLNNAGIASMNHFLLTPGKSVTEIFQCNFMGTFLCSREAVKLLKKSPAGRIINFSTIAVPLRLAGSAVYAASKSAVSTLTEITAKELAPFGITVNVIGPTPVPTSMTRTLPKESIDAVIDQQIIKRFGKIEDIINVIEFFINTSSDFITGQTIYFGGVIK